MAITVSSETMRSALQRKVKAKNESFNHRGKKVHRKKLRKFVLVNWPLPDAKNVEQFGFHLQALFSCHVTYTAADIEKTKGRAYSNVVEKKSFDYNCCNTTPGASCDDASSRSSIVAMA